MDNLQVRAFGLVIISFTHFLSGLDAYNSANQINWENRDHLMQVKWVPDVSSDRIGVPVRLKF